MVWYDIVDYGTQWYGVVLLQLYSIILLQLYSTLYSNIYMGCCVVMRFGVVGQSGKVGSKVMLHLFTFVFLFQAKVLICVNVLLAQSPSLWLKYTDDWKFAYVIIRIRNSNDRTNKTHYHLFKSSWFLIGKEPTVKSSYSNQLNYGF